MVLTFASVHHSVQIADCWTVFSCFALDWLAVRCQFSDTFTRARVMDLDSLGLLGWSLDLIIYFLILIKKTSLAVVLNFHDMAKK